MKCKKISICFNSIKCLENKLVTFLNPYSTFVLYEKGLLYKICENFDYIFIDGIALVKAIEFKYKLKGMKRISFDMTSLAPIIFNYAMQNNKSIYFIGTKENIIDKSVRNIKFVYPRLNVISYRHGYFKDKEEYQRVVKIIKDINPDIVIAGMGTPLQELFLLDLRKAGWKGTGFTCGGFLEQTAQNIKYYPELINKFHLRWLYRLYKEPKRLFKRYFYVYPKFFIKFFQGEILL